MDDTAEIKDLLRLLLAKVDTLATKAELAEFKAEVRGEFAEFKAHVNGEFKAVNARLDEQRQTINALIPTRIAAVPPAA